MEVFLRGGKIESQDSVAFQLESKFLLFHGVDRQKGERLGVLWTSLCALSGDRFVSF